MTLTGARKVLESATEVLPILLPDIFKNEHEFWEKVAEIFSKVVDFLKNGGDLFTW